VAGTNALRRPTCDLPALSKVPTHVTPPPTRLAVFTSGGDASGMNAAVRAVVRTALHHGIEPYAILEGYAGMVAGGDQIRRIGSDDVGGILHRGGSVIGSARSQEFRTRDGRRRAAANLVERGIEALVCIGGDGSLTGADRFREEWPSLLDELVDDGTIEREVADRYPRLRLVGLVGSIDNDMFGTDMTIGADTALHRITEAIDAIHSTAASHQRSFVIEVMGRHCGYLALMSTLATGANWVLIPESPPDTDDWRGAMCSALRAGRRSGRRQNIVIVAEGARDRHGNPITSDEVKEVLEAELGEDTRVTILGHVQRGGAPSAFDRNLATMLGSAAVDDLRTADPEDVPQVIGLREHQIVRSPLVDAVAATQRVAQLIEERRYDEAMRMRGGSFAESFATVRTLTRARPHAPTPGQTSKRFAILHGGGPAPGMNTAVRAAVRLALDAGHTVLAVRDGFAGLRDGRVHELDWMSVTEWTWRGGAELGISRFVPGVEDLDTIAHQLEEHAIDGLLMIGGWAGYVAAHLLHAHRDHHPALDLPIVCLPASINNDLPGSELSIGADTALNSIVRDVDKIKQSAVAAGRCFVVEVMGYDSGYLALLSGLATGAEQVYLPEEGISLDTLRADVELLRAGFEGGKRLGLMIRNEHADVHYTTPFIASLLEKEGGELFDVRQAILGHVQQGGDPTPFDRIQATRLATRCIDHLCEQSGRAEPFSAFIGLEAGRVRFTDLAEFPRLVEPDARRPSDQDWMSQRALARVMAGRTDEGDGRS
jgi:6-phosphofructokinase 1